MGFDIRLVPKEAEKVEEVPKKPLPTPIPTPVGRYTEVKVTKQPLHSVVSKKLQEQEEEEELREELAVDVVLEVPRQESILVDEEIADEEIGDALSMENWTKYNPLSREAHDPENDEHVEDVDTLIKSALIESAAFRARRRTRKKASRNKIAARVRALKNQGMNLEEIYKSLSRYRPNTLRKAHIRKDVASSQLQTSIGVIRSGEDRVCDMFPNGCFIASDCFSLLGSKSRWNFNPIERYDEGGLKQGVPMSSIYMLSRT